MFIKLGIRYGSDESQTIANHIMATMFREAVFASNELAEKKGAFPLYDDDLFKSSIILNHFTSDEIELLKEYGLRNCSLLSIAPSGSISNLFKVSNSAEPAYALQYTRKTESLKGKDSYYTISIDVVKEYKELHNTDVLPNYFVTALDIPWIERIEMQSQLQMHVDTAISSTVNLPEKITVEEMEKFYLEAWERGLKGITIFREGCEKEAILTINSKKGTKPVKVKPEDLIGRRRTVVTGCGNLHVEACHEEDTGIMREVWLEKGSEGGCQSYMIGLSRMISLALRVGATVDDVLDQLLSVPACSSYTDRRAKKHDTSKGTCCPGAIAFALKEIQEKYYEKPEVVKEEARHAKCPECGQNGLIHAGGCMECIYCGKKFCGD